MLRKKCFAFLLSAAMIFGGITGAAADPQTPGSGQTNMEDGMQPGSGDELPEYAGGGGK